MTRRLALATALLVSAILALHCGFHVGIPQPPPGLPPVMELPMPTHPVAIDYLTPELLEARVTRMRDRALTPERRCQRLALHAVGLVRDVEAAPSEDGRTPGSRPPDWGPALTAFYVAGSDTIFATAAATPAALRHEWVHALDDQRSPRLERGIAAPTTDEALATRAAVEGTALVAVPVPLAPLPFTTDLDINAWILSYQLGSDYVRRASSTDLDDAFRLAPRSVAQVLFDAAPPLPSTIPPSTLRPGERLLCSDRVGALGVLTVLRRFRITARAATAIARAWREDRMDRIECADGAVRVEWQLRFATRSATLAWANLTRGATVAVVEPVHDRS